jgi:autotransporter-associated beta strand protein
MVVRGGLPMTFSGPIDLGGAQRTITVANEGTLQTSAHFAGGASRGGITKSGDGRLVLSGPNTYTGDTLVSSGTLTYGSTQSNSSLLIGPDARAEVAAGGDKTLVIRQLAISGGATPVGTLDLFDNDMKIANASYADVTAQIAHARNFGFWDQPGITSTSAAAHPNGTTTLGTLRGGEYLAIYDTAPFNGFAVAATDVLVKYTYYGDADFNGFVDGDDYARADNGFNTGLSGWVNGDFDYSGGVDGDDYALLDNAYNLQSGTLRQVVRWLENGGVDPLPEGAQFELVRDHAVQFGSGYVSAFLSSVPEPGSLCSVFFALGIAFRRQRRFF